MLRLPTTAALAILIAGPAVAADAHRELGAHQHGHATLNIAFEGNTISMELEAPGMDIVGFEHAASSEAERAAEAKAKALLTDPTQLFRLPAAAGCSLGSGKVVVESGHDHDRAAQLLVQV